MKLTKLFWFLLFVVGYVIYHVLTLDVTPTPWFDETLFASISNSFLQSGKFDLTIAPYFEYADGYNLYGPMYFLTTAGVTKWLGFGVFTFRLTAFVFGLMFIRMIAKQYKLRFGHWWGALLFLIDPVVQSNIHEARMDTMALVFTFGAVFTFMKYVEKDKMGLLIWSAILAGAAMLTTPRVAFLLLFVPVFIHKCEWKLLWWPVICGSMYLGWVLIAFDSFSAFVDYYKGFNSVFESLRFGFDQALFVYNYPLILAVVVLLLFNVQQLKSVFLDDRLALFSVCTIVVFHLFVKGGCYVIFVLPQYYYLLQLFMPDSRRLAAGLKWSFVGFGLLVMGIRIISNVGAVHAHEQSYALISDVIPAGSKVVGSSKFYYAALAADAEYQSSEFWWLSPVEKRMEYHENTYDFDYFIADRNGKDSFTAYQNRFDFKEVGSCVSVTPIMFPALQEQLSRWITFNTKSYDCTIYKRVK